jgi:LPXTG-motif cell wall-anchored protein
MKSIRRARILLILLLIMTVFAINAVPAMAADDAISVSGTYTLTAANNNGTLTVNPGLTVTINGTSGTTYTNLYINCGAGVILTINDVEINNASGPVSVISFVGAGNELILLGNNVISGIGASGPAIKVEGTTALTISGSGSVTANGGGECAGIGSGDESSVGTINIIGSGAVTATGGANGAGIGGGSSDNSGTINISGSGIVTATGGTNAAGIGGGYYGGAGGAIVKIFGNVKVIATSGTAGNAEDIGAGAGISGSGTLEISGTSQVFLAQGLNFSTTPTLIDHTAEPGGLLTAPAASMAGVGALYNFTSPAGWEALSTSGYFTEIENAPNPQTGDSGYTWIYIAALALLLVFASVFTFMKSKKLI